MRKFAATYRHYGHRILPLTVRDFLFEVGSSVDRPVEKIDSTTYIFELTDGEIALMRKRIINSALCNLQTPKDAPQKTVGLYLRQYASQPPCELINVTEIPNPEMLSEEMRETPDLAERSITFTPHSDGLPDLFLTNNPHLPKHAWWQHQPYGPAVDQDGRCRHHGFAHSPYYDCYVNPPNKY